MAEVIDKANEQIAEELKEKLISKAAILLKRKESLIKELDKIDSDLALLDSGKDISVFVNSGANYYAITGGTITSSAVGSNYK